MLFDKAFLASLLATTAVAKPIFQRQTSGGIRGVNIGGWLVLEPWITPSIFQNYDGSIIDEYTLTQSAPDAESVLQSHWASWATEGDFQKIAGAGLNLVRIPVGYWAFQKYDGDPYIQGAAEYLDQAVQWAANAGLNVWIDLHGAPLSQNGFDNSGQRTTSPGWLSGDTISFTANVIGEIAQRYGSKPNVVGIELLNEPLTPVLNGGIEGTKQYYTQGYNAVRGSFGGSIPFSDGFVQPSEWNGFLTGQNTIVNHHEYQVFTNELLQLDYQGHVDKVYSSAAEWASGADKPVVNGEWTAAMTDCAPALNGYGIGARYDGTFSRRNYDGTYESSQYIGSCANVNFIDQWSPELKQATTNYIRAQIDVSSNQASGWIFWNFKTEAAAEWDFFRLLDNGVWPS